MADDRWNNRSDSSYDRNWNREERHRYGSDRRPRESQGAYGPGGYDSGDIGYGRHLGGYSGTGSNANQGLAAPGAFTDFGAPSSGGYSSQYGSPSSPPSTAWLGSNRGERDRGVRGDYPRSWDRPGEQRSFGPGNDYVQDITDGGEARGQHLGEHRGHGPRNYRRSDERIHDDVNDRLTDDAWLDAQDIDVAVKDREVTLTGTVNDRTAKRRAENLAEQVSGVENVQNNLRVRRAEDQATAGSGPIA